MDKLGIVLDTLIVIFTAIVVIIMIASMEQLVYIILNELL